MNSQLSNVHKRMLVRRGRIQRVQITHTVCHKGDNGDGGGVDKLGALDVVEVDTLHTAHMRI